MVIAAAVARIGTRLSRLAAVLRTRRPGAGRPRLATSGLFDGAAYLVAFPDVRASGLDPLDHFMLYGWREGRDPNPLFEVRWYLSNNPDVAAAGLNPCYIIWTPGRREGRSASPGFSARYYAERYADVASARTSLLAHYLAHGRTEGRSGAPSMAPDAGEPVAEATLAAVKPFGVLRGAQLALLACHAAGGRLKPHVPAYAAALAKAGYAVGLVAMTDAPFHADEGLVESLAALYVRENRGLDFAAWAHLLREEPTLFGAQALLLANDSVLPRAAPVRWPRRWRRCRCVRPTWSA